MLNPMGLCLINEIDCRYAIGKDKIYLVPVNISRSGELYRHMESTNHRFITINNEISQKAVMDYIYYSDVFFNLKGVVLRIFAIVEYYANMQISEIEIVSEELGFYYSPAELYYLERKEGKYGADDLLYGTR